MNNEREDIIHKTDNLVVVKLPEFVFQTDLAAKSFYRATLALAKSIEESERETLVND